MQVQRGKYTTIARRKQKTKESAAFFSTRQIIFVGCRQYGIGILVSLVRGTGACSFNMLEPDGLPSSMLRDGYSRTSQSQQSTDCDANTANHRPAKSHCAKTPK